MKFIQNPAHPEWPICKHLRTRASYVPDLQNEHYMQVHHPYANYYCLKTLMAIGPDDDVCSAEDCIPGRTCFEPLTLPRAQLARR